jgi:hypothetical protein
VEAVGCPPEVRCLERNKEIAEILMTATQTNALYHALSESSKDYKQILEEEEALDVRNSWTKVHRVHRLKEPN